MINSFVDVIDNDIMPIFMYILPIVFFISLIIIIFKGFMGKYINLGVILFKFIICFGILFAFYWTYHCPIMGWCYPDANALNIFMLFSLGIMNLILSIVFAISFRKYSYLLYILANSILVSFLLEYIVKFIK